MAALALAFCAGAAAAEERRVAADGARAGAPPLPFRYVGRLTQNGKVEVLLIRGDRLYSISAGQKIGDDYLVEHVGASSIRFRYLPLKRRQSMDLPGAY